MNTPSGETGCKLCGEWAERCAKLVRMLCDESICSGPNCRMRIYWGITREGKRIPLNLDGTAHWTNCPDAERFRKHRKRKRGETER